MRHFSFGAQALGTLLEGIYGLALTNKVNINVCTIDGSNISARRHEGVLLTPYSSIYVTKKGFAESHLVVEIKREEEYEHIAVASTGSESKETVVEVYYDIENNLVTLISHPDDQRIIMTAIQIK